MATTQLTASSISTRNLSSFEGFRTSAIEFPRNNARIGILSQRSFPSMVVKAAATDKIGANNNITTRSEKGRKEIAEAKGIVKHIVVAKFKDEISEELIDEQIKGYANLVNLIPQMKSFHWGKDVSVDNLQQGFTHVFESTFESVEAIVEYNTHPAHVEFANLFLSSLEKVLMVDYKPKIVNL